MGQALVNPSGELEFIGTTMDITDLKRTEQMEIAIAREREPLMRQRAAELAKANEALLSCLDALASVQELDRPNQIGAVDVRARTSSVEQCSKSL